MRVFFVSVFFFGIFFFLSPQALAAPGASCTNSDGAIGVCELGSCSTGKVPISTGGCSTNEICCQTPSALGGFGSGASTSGSVGPCPTGFERQSGVCFPMAGSTGLGDMSIYDLLQRVMNWLLGIVGVLAVIAFVISGVQYLVSAGEEKMVETAKRNMKYAIVGLVVALSGLIILNAVAGLTGAGGVTNF